MALEPLALATLVAQKLHEHFGSPNWFGPSDPLDELVSTILSQNTNDRNRDAAFENMKKTFPSWEEVRDADPAALIESLRVAGLANQKAPRIQEILRKISQERGSLDLEFLRSWKPEDVHDWLVGLNGVGPKTAAIVMVFSLGMAAFPVDTHIYRVSGRIGLRPPTMTVEQAHIHLARLFQPADYGEVHLNLIRLGREICSARRPECSRCPLSDYCVYHKNQVNSKP